MATILKSTTVKSTWLLEPAKQTTHLLERSELGLRIVEFRNDSAKDCVEVRLIRGDGRTKDFEELAKYEDKTQVEATAIVAALAKAS